MFFRRILSKGKRDRGEQEVEHAAGSHTHAVHSGSTGPDSNRPEPSHTSVEMLGAARAYNFARQASERVRSRCCLHGMHDDSVLHVAGDRKARYIASASADRTLAVFDLEHDTDKPLWRGLHTAYVQAVEFSGSGTMVASVGGDRWAEPMPSC